MESGIFESTFLGGWVNEIRTKEVRKDKVFRYSGIQLDFCVGFPYLQIVSSINFIIYIIIIIYIIKISS